MESFIKNFKEIETNAGKGLQLDLEKAYPFEKNVYVSYLRGRINSEDVITPLPYLMQKNNELIGEGAFHKETLAYDYANDIGECMRICNDYNIVVLLGKKGYAGKILNLDDKDEVFEREEDKDCSESSMYYTHAGLHTAIKYLEKKYPERLVNLLKAKKDSNSNPSIIFS